MILGNVYCVLLGREYTLKKKALLNQINAGIKNDEIKYKNAGVADTGSVIMQKRLVRTYVHRLQGNNFSF